MAITAWKHRPARVAISAAAVVWIPMTFACGGNPVAQSPVVPSAATFTVSTVSFTSDPQDFAGRGESRVYTLQNAAIRANVARSGGLISVAVQPAGNPPPLQSSLLLIAPTGQRIGRGEYDTTRLGTSSTYALDFEVDQRMCNTEAGHAVIHSVEFGPDLLSVTELRVSFENHCNGSSAVLRGEVTVLADPLR